MVKSIVRDAMFLAIQSVPATKADRQTAMDLLDTLRAHLDHCVGMAANMIGVSKRMIAVHLGYTQLVMINPVVLFRSGAYEAEEGCLSLEGVRKTTRYECIDVEYLDLSFKKQRRRFEGYTAQIIQHEMDHCDGILI